MLSSGYMPDSTIECNSRSSAITLRAAMMAARKEPSSLSFMKGLQVHAMMTDQWVLWLVPAPACFRPYGTTAAHGGMCL